MGSEPTFISVEKSSNSPLMDRLNVYHKTSRGVLTRDVSLQSDDGSSVCSSVESVLELRKPDPETVLLELGFGPPHSIKYLTRIPQRFLQPSKLLKHIDINRFLEKQGELHFSHKKITSPSSSPSKDKVT